MTAAIFEYPGHGEAPWAAVEQCPACGSGDGVLRGAIPDRHYVFGSEEVLIPDSGIAMIECGACGLIYKSTVPDPAFLAEVFERQASKKWLVPYDFSVEAAALRRLMGRAAFDLLDVGAAGGPLLKACADGGMIGGVQRSMSSAIQASKFTSRANSSRGLSTPRH